MFLLPRHRTTAGVAARKTSSRLTLFATVTLVLFSFVWRYYYSGVAIKGTGASQALEVPPDLRFFLAFNFVNSSALLADFLPELKELLLKLGPDQVYVSIYENGSCDDTGNLLRGLVPWLKKYRVPHYVRVNQTLHYNATLTDLRTRPESVDRIQWMAMVRNAALARLYAGGLGLWPGVDPDRLRVVFFNDVHWKVSDFLTLLHTNNQAYDIACAMDFYTTFYDTWVTRDIQGRVPSGVYPYLRERKSQRLLKEGKPIPVRACWNGLVVLKAQPFLMAGPPVRFRHCGWGRGEKAKEGEEPCYASECQLVCDDFRRHGYTQVFMNPQVKVTYEKSDYSWHHQWWLSWVDFALGLFYVPLWPVFLPTVDHPGDFEECFGSQPFFVDQPWLCIVLSATLCIGLCAATIVLPYHYRYATGCKPVNAVKIK